MTQASLFKCWPHLSAFIFLDRITSESVYNWRLVLCFITSKQVFFSYLFQPSTLPQGTVNMNLCTDVVDAEPLTGQKNSLCIITPEQEYFIRGENKEIING